MNQMRRRFYPKSAPKKANRAARSTGCGKGFIKRGSGSAFARTPAVAITLCPEHAGMAIEYLILAVPRDKSKPFYWDGAGWTKAKHRAKPYTHLSHVKKAYQEIKERPPVCSSVLALFEVEPPGPKDWTPRKTGGKR